MVKIIKQELKFEECLKQGLEYTTMYVRRNIEK